MRLLVSLLLLGLLAAPARAWTDHGHALVAQIAWQLMSPQAREWVEGVLAEHPDPAVSDLEQASVWPDLIKESRPETFAWHFVNLPVTTEPGTVLQSLDESLTLARERLPEADILMALEWSLAGVQGSADHRAGFGRAEWLCWLVHLVGDLHQPLHAAELVSPDFPEGDQGGNLMLVWSGERMVTLHFYWDTGGLTRVDGPADLSWSPQVDPAALGPLDWKLWAAESRLLAARFAYQGVRPGSVLGPEYREMVEGIYRERVGLAGVRLARILEQLARGEKL